MATKSTHNNFNTANALKSIESIGTKLHAVYQEWDWADTIDHVRLADILPAQTERIHDAVENIAMAEKLLRRASRDLQSFRFREEYRPALEKFRNKESS